MAESSVVHVELGALVQRYEKSFLDPSADLTRATLDLLTQKRAFF